MLQDYGNTPIKVRLEEKIDMGGYAVLFTDKLSGEGRKIVVKKLLDSTGRSMIKEARLLLKLHMQTLSHLKEFALISLRYFWSSYVEFDFFRVETRSTRIYDIRPSVRHSSVRIPPFPDTPIPYSQF